MKRRELAGMLGAAMVAWPLAAGAQPKAVLIGGLIVGNDDAGPLQAALREELRKADYVEGRNFAFEFRSAEQKLDRLPKLAAELVGLKVDIIVALYTPCALAAQKATQQIPIVVIAANPVETGLVETLGHPGRNITGVSLMSMELHAKCVEIFHDMLPATHRVAFLGNAADPSSTLFSERVQLAGKAAGIEIAPVIIVRTPDEIGAAFEAIKKAGTDAVVVQGSLASQTVADLALKYRLAAATVPRSFAQLGGLVSYGADGPESFRRGAGFVVKILRGGNPAEMPVEQPTKFELVINLKTAKALGLTVAESFLLRADTVIQ